MKENPFPEREEELARGFYWLSPPTPGRGGLAGMPRPGEADLTRLPTRGIGLVVSLLESYHESSPLPPGLRRVRLPITDNGAPADEHWHFVLRLCAFMHWFRQQGGDNCGVAVHCLHGRGRTGLILTAYRAYVAARWPGDPDAHPPTTTIPEVNRRLEATHGVPSAALGIEQTRWAALFPQRLQRGIEPRWEAAAAGEIGWQRVLSGERGAGPGVRWECPDCGSVASHPKPAEEAPFWCPGCGWATGAGVEE